MPALNLEPLHLIEKPRTLEATQFDEYKETLQKLEKQAEALREADRRKDEFLAMLAHELRNPLASVANAVALLRTSEEAEERIWATDVIARQTGQLTRLIDDLLDVSRIASGKIHLRKGPLDLAIVLNHAVETARPLIDGRKLEIATDCPAGSLLLEADPARLEQIVLNLLINAAKYTPAGGHISLQASRDGNDVVVKVRDDGIGIVSEKLPGIFDLFAQSDQAIPRAEGGLGIGLAVVQKLAELHGGRVSASSDGDGAGSEFVVRLPAGRARKTAPARRSDSESPRNGARHARILVVDDSVDSANCLSRLLTRRGHQVQVANDGRQALSVVNSFQPNVVLLDIGLPGMDGYEVAVRLRQDPAFRNGVLIAITGYAQEDDRKRCEEAGFDHHLTKPFDLDHLQRLICDLDHNARDR